MEYSVLFFVAWLLSGAVTALIGAVAITYVRRTWRLMRADADESAQERPEGVFLARLAGPVAEDRPGVAGGGSEEAGLE